MLGAFLAFGVDTLVIVVALWCVGELSRTVAGAVASAVLLAFSLWVGVRWIRFRVNRSERDSGEGADHAERRDPLDELKRRYASGELSDAEFEARLDGLLDPDQRAEQTNEANARREERSCEPE
jgi:uncharacterized membrane protein